jgi:phosphoenolpyruvate phosphomutase-like protein
MTLSQSLPSAPGLVAETHESSRQDGLASRRKAFRALHERGCFVIPNPWEVGTARYLQHLGFPALATTSAGFALDWRAWCRTPRSTVCLTPTFSGHPTPGW